MSSNRGALQPPHAAIKQRSSRKRWVIVTFPEGNDYSVITTNWVLKSVDGLGNKVIKCLWAPFSNVTSDIIQNAMEPSDNWSTHTIKLQENGKEYSCFNKAWHKQVEMSEESSTEQSKRSKINEESSDSDGGSEEELIQTNKQNKMMGLLNLIYKEQIQNRVLYDRLLSKVNNIETNFDENFLLNWPIINEQTFKHVENSLLDNLFVQQMVLFFNSIGGNSVKDNLKRILIKMFSDELAIRCSWTGRGKDITTKLCDAKIVTVLKRCIRKNQKEYSDALFESVFADWFRYATTRHRRSLETNH
ncbi:uncharacterized protein LOC126845464 [Adelges cooleyi]|uniref:uncharacterized protein LOC126845464 n=1 Tax=Adelges cooleyi TaxID=133065 RepID=UPI00217FDDF5|nr:uncharacterized protein LOC126845464 [Adelges cooleyi]